MCVETSVAATTAIAQAPVYAYRAGEKVGSAALDPVEGQTPQRTLEQLRSLPPMELGQEILEVFGRRCFVAFQAEQALQVLELVIHKRKIEKNWSGWQRAAR